MVHAVGAVNRTIHEAVQFMQRLVTISQQGPNGGSTCKVEWGAVLSTLVDFGKVVDRFTHQLLLGGIFSGDNLQRMHHLHVAPVAMIVAERHSLPDHVAVFVGRDSP